MYVTDVEYLGFTPDGDCGAFQGSISLIAGDHRVTVPLTLPRQVEIANSQHRLLLLAAALRKARRMPEYRKKGSIRFAPGILPPGLRCG